jgi:hypothetical protein
MTIFFSDVFIFQLTGQSSPKWSNPAYRYYSRPGFVDIAEISGGYGIGSTEGEYAKNFAGISNIFGYQVNRNFFQGAGLEYSICYDGSLLNKLKEFKA